jgi:hypothetical protein
MLILVSPSPESLPGFVFRLRSGVLPLIAAIVFSLPRPGGFTPMTLFFPQRLSLPWQKRTSGVAADAPENCGKLYTNSYFRNTLSNPTGVHDSFFWEEFSSSGYTLRAGSGLPDTTRREIPSKPIRKEDDSFTRVS